MPNWCANSVTVVGPAALVQALVDSRFDLAGILPEPDYDQVEVAPAFAEEGGEQVVSQEEAWWHWRVAHWGTKWNVSESEELHAWIKSRDEAAGTLVAGFGFDSAWSPPVGCYVALKEQGLHVRALYYEAGTDFMGIWDDGEDRIYAASDYSSDSSFWSTEDGAALDGCFELVEDLLEQESRRRR